MTTQSPRLTITLNPEWTPELDRLKQEMFYNAPKADVIRYLIGLGLQARRELEKAR